MNETKMRKKLALLKQKILTSTHISHNNQQYQVSDLNKEQEGLVAEIKDNLKQFKLSLEIAKEKYEEKLSLYSQYLDESQKNDKWISTDNLKAYLNQEKSTMKKLIQNEEKNNQINDDRLHKLVKKRKIETILRQVKKNQLQTEIKHLQQTMIGSNVILYEIPEEKMSEKEEQLLNSKISMLLEEVQRLCSLEQVCKIGSKQQMSKIQQNLKKQTQRLETVENLVSKEHKEVKAFEKWVEIFEQIDIPLYLKAKSDKFVLGKEVNSIDGNEVEEIMGLWNPTSGIVSSMTVENEQIGGQIKSLKQQIKKLQSRR